VTAEPDPRLVALEARVDNLARQQEQLHELVFATLEVMRRLTVVALKIASETRQ
jgi:hypothetical protein